MDDNAKSGFGLDSAGNEPRRVIVPPPIDMEHLSRQTLGDGGVAREVLSLFLMEVGSARAIMQAEVEIERREVAHRMKGAARAIGAFALAETAAAIEEAPDNSGFISDFLERVVEIEDFIADFGKE